MPSFDVVSQVDLQEVRNAVDQAQREITTRFDFKGTDSSVKLVDEQIVVDSATDHRVDAAIDVLKTKLVKRKVSLKSVTQGEMEAIGGGRSRTTFTLNQGIPQDAARELVKMIKDRKMKVQAAIQGDTVRVSGKKRDDLQTVIAMFREANYRLPLQYVNQRD
ncbi:MAG: YajQ family cyclic di-GMP-binding protein [bacterium]|nr:YajQ family cyclic di-GMP-binding protein [bacterium]